MLPYGHHHLMKNMWWLLTIAPSWYLPPPSPGNSLFYQIYWGFLIPAPILGTPCFIGFGGDPWCLWTPCFARFIWDLWCLLKTCISCQAFLPSSTSIITMINYCPPIFLTLDFCLWSWFCCQYHWVHCSYDLHANLLQKKYKIKNLLNK